MSARRFLAEAERVPGAAHGAVPVRGALRGHPWPGPGQRLGVEHLPSVQQAPGGQAASPAPVGRAARGGPGGGTAGGMGLGLGAGACRACEQAACPALLPHLGSQQHFLGTSDF